MPTDARTTNRLLLCSAVILLLYLRAYFSVPTRDIEVSQASLASVTDDLLLAKRPLIIVDRIIDHVDMVRRSGFRLLHILAFVPRQCTEGLAVRATARFTLLFQSRSESGNVEIRHPLTRARVVMVLHRDQTLVLPPRWVYACSPGFVAYELHDVVSLVVTLLFRPMRGGGGIPVTPTQ